MGRATLDANFRPTLIGVDKISYTIPTEAAVDATSHALLVEGQELVPTDSSMNNPEIVITYDLLGNVKTITQIIGTSQYQRTLSFTGEELTDVTPWVKL